MSLMERFFKSPPMMKIGSAYKKTVDRRMRAWGKHLFQLTNKKSMKKLN